jgi:hypothetical protein
MTEFFPDEFTRSGHFPNTGVLVLDLHRLLTMFLSSKKLAEMRTEEAHDPIGWLQQYEEDELHRILLSTAIAARAIDDRDHKFLDNYETNCGQLISDTKHPEAVQPLNLREACNKILHAKVIHGDLDEVDWKKYSNPILYFYGSYNGKDWKATLNVVDYVLKYVETIGMGFH